MKRTRNCLAALLVAALALVCSTRAIGYALLWDDVVLLDLVRSLEQEGGPAAVLRSEFLSPGLSGYYRPVVMASLLLDERISSWLPDPFHLTNVLLHVAVSLLVLLFFQLITGSGLIALVGACLFAVHPSHVESVAFVSGRTDLWAALFCLVTAVCCWRDLPGSGHRSWLLRTVGWAAAGLAVLSKEVSLVLPLVILLGRLPLVRGEGAPARKHLLVWFLGSTLAQAAAVSVRLWWAGVPFRSPMDNPAGGQAVSLGQQVGTMLIAALTDVRLLVLPWPLKALYTAADLRITGTALIAVVLLLALIMVGRGAALRSGYSLPLVWLAGFLAPVLLAPVARWALVAERFLYLPSVGYALLVGNAVAGAARWRKMARPAVAAAALLVAVFAGLSIVRTRVWRDGETLFQHIVDSSPDSPEGYVDLGTVRQRQGRIQEAIALYRQALDLKPDHVDALNNLGNALFNSGRVDEALPPLAEAVRLRPDFTEALISLSAVLAAHGRYADARELCERAVGLDGRNAEGRYNLGLLYLRLGLTDQVRLQYQALRDLDAGLAEELLLKLGRGQRIPPGQP